jgi:hypothetical protein
MLSLNSARFAVRQTEPSGHRSVDQSAISLHYGVAVDPDFGSYSAPVRLVFAVA